MTDVSRWNRVKQLFESALERPTAERAAFLEGATDDEALRSEVRSLIASHDDAGGFLESHAIVADLSVVSLAPGTRVGPYEIGSPIGSGGMGEVYRARDVRLGREVAVKVLPREWARDAERRDRFQAEARAASALNHPNIIAVHDTGTHEHMPFVVTELLEGQSLADRLRQGPLPVRKMLECATQVARGLAAAHERGIVHRDLKPANLFLTTTGHVKILDFGLAKLMEGGSAIGSLAPGVHRPTTPGMFLGTVGYISPEQARGERVDGRSDQFSLGCVMYELLTGRGPFERRTAAESIAAILATDPPSLADVNPSIPRQVAWILERCLAKDPHDRYGATADLARDLELALQRLSELSGTAVAIGHARRRAGGVWLAMALAAAGLAAAWWLRSETPSVPVLRYLTYSGQDGFAAAAPDGRTLAFSSTRDGRRRIWLKHVDEGSEVPLTDGEDAHARFSPDGSTILFVRNTKGRIALYRVASVGGEPRKLVEDALSGDFSPDGRRIAFVRQFQEEGAITTVVATAATDGGSVRELARLAARDYPAGPFDAPRWSPDGRHVAVTQRTLQLGIPTVVAVIETETGGVRTLDLPNQAGVWPGALAWADGDQIVCAQPQSVVGQQTGMTSSVVLMNVRSGRTRPLLWSPVNVIALDPIGPGRLVLGSSTVRHFLREIPLQPQAATSGASLTHGNGADRQPVYSRDGALVLFSSNRSSNQDIWSVSRDSGAVHRLTDDIAHDLDPALMPDGRLLWSSNRSGHFEVWMAEADGSGARQVTRDGVDAENPVPTPDGQWIVYASANPATRGIARVRPDGTQPLVVVPGNNIIPEVSPDGLFVAFVADLGSNEAALRVARIDDGEVVFSIPLPSWVYWLGGPGLDQGRCRWWPDGRALVFILHQPEGGSGVYWQDFEPGADTSGTRRLLAAEPGLEAESLGVSPDGTSLAVSYREQLFDLLLAEGVAGLEDARRIR